MSAPRPRTAPPLITGIGLLSPLGHRVATLHDRLVAGASGIRSGVGEVADALPGKRVAALPEPGPETHLGSGNLRPLDRTSRMAAAAAQLTLVDAGWTAEQAEAHELGLVLGTMFGSVRTIFAFDRRAQTAGPSYVKPFDFANSVINAAAGQTAIWHDLRGANATVAGGVAAGLQAVGYALDLLRAGRAEALLVGGADELSFEASYGFLRRGLVAGATGGSAALSVPFHPRRSGFTPGEAAALMSLETAASAQRRGATPHAVLHGFAAGYDVSRGRDRDAATRTVARVVQEALADAAVPARAVGLWSASASGGHRDAIEAAGVACALGDHAARVPVLAIKGQLGESLGASAALQTVMAIESLGRGHVPGVAGLDTLPTYFPFPLAGPAPRPVATCCRALVTALGLDGVVCALVLGGPEVTP